MKTIESAIAADIHRLVEDEITAELGDLLSPESRRKLAARLIKVIEDYNRQVAISVMEKAKQTMVVQAIASAAKDSLMADENNK